jgi:hypothetical protein
VRATIEGQGIGATRYCEFTTGTFVEPITAWEHPVRLAFDVTDQPPALIELSPYRQVHPPHFAGYLTSKRGEFRLIELPGGRTRLEGRTWYSFAMYPEGYWTLWSDLLIHRIHRRVLEHIKAVSERPRIVVPRQSEASTFREPFRGLPGTASVPRAALARTSTRAAGQRT